MNEARGRPRIAHIAIQVADIDRAASFYEEVFGFRRTDTRTERGRTSCHLTDGATDLAMVEFHEGAGRSRARPVTSPVSTTSASMWKTSRHTPKG